MAQEKRGAAVRLPRHDGQPAGKGGLLSQPSGTLSGDHQPIHLSLREASRKKRRADEAGGGAWVGPHADGE